MIRFGEIGSLACSVADCGINHVSLQYLWPQL